MKLVKPASDPYHRERIDKKTKTITITKRMHRPMFSLLPYYALSHLWGITETNPHLWSSIGDYVDDENGQPVAPVSMRPEKRDTLLKLLKHYPDSYWWIDVLCARTDTPLDIMGDIYAKCNKCIAMIDCDPDIIPQVHSSMKQLRDTIKGADDDRHSSAFWTASRMLDALAQCHWWKRVWTYQEMVLPETVKLISERTLQISTSHFLDIDALKDFPGMLDHKAWRLGGIYVCQSFQEFRLLTPSRIIYKIVYDAWNPHPDGVCLEEIGVSRKMKKHFGDPDVEAVARCSLLKTFGRSARRSMDPADYVYGVLGILRIYIPRKANPDEVWQLFLERLSSKVTIRNHMTEFNLATARNMTDVYGIFIE